MTENDTQQETSLHDRDYSEEFAVTLEWWEWNHLFSVYCTGMRAKEGDWPEEETDRDWKLREKLAVEIGDASPGNGMDDWPDSMKDAYNESVMEMIEDV